jgi:UPF0042 nucleotide-binding protein
MTEQTQLQLTLFSFGFKYGSPTDSNLVFDVRLLPNPYWVEELRSKTGLESHVAEYVLRSEKTQNLISRIEPLLDFMINESIEAGKKELRVAIGCTGGRHRSVAVTEMLASLIQGKVLSLKVLHRDIDKDD